MKFCYKCKEEKPRTQFSPDSQKKDGLKLACKPCRNKENNEYRLRHPENYRRVNLAYARSERGKYINRANRLKNDFWPELTADEAYKKYKQMEIEQDHCCALCGKHRSEFKFDFAVDHCHETKVVRGLLCNICNRFEVGKHTVKTVQKLYDYIVKSSKN